MMYEVLLWSKSGDAEWFYDSILPGLIPDRVFDLMEVGFVKRELELCGECEVAFHCHIQDETKGRALCPVLFADTVRPPWTVAQLV
jgi:hypothetical protein